MTTVEEAAQIVIENKASFGIETVLIQDALGRILQENLCADRPFPPFDRVTMDGIAIDFSQYKNGQRTFKIEAVSPAGKPQGILSNPENCIEVMTGTTLPSGANTVIRYEDLKILEDHATITAEAEVIEAQNVHYKGQDRTQNEVIVPIGLVISPAEIGVAASIGKPSILVSKRPKAVVISTGDELVEVNQQPLPHQIRTSNGYAIQAALLRWGVEAEQLHLIDDKELLENELARCLEIYDVIIFSGGVSAGKFDYVPTALEKLNVKKLFHKVAQRPGKPFWFGKSQNHKAVFALPGNPVSTFMCLHRYFKPWLDASQGIETKHTVATLNKDVPFKADLTYFLQVRLTQNENGQYEATPITGNGSGDLANLADADAFMELPTIKKPFLKDSKYRIYKYR